MKNNSGCRQEFGKCQYDDLRFSWDFTGASLGTVERLSKDWYHLDLRKDTWFWFYFKLEGAAGRKIIFQVRDRTPEMEKVCGYWIRHEDKNTTTVCHKPRFSYDRNNWDMMENSEQDFHEPDLVRFSQEFKQDTVWICYGIPYSPKCWHNFISRFDGNQDIKKSVLGYSRLGYPVECLTVSDFSVPDEKKKTGWILCREDQAETTGSLVLEGGIEILMSREAAEIREKLIINILPMVSIDAIMCGAPFSCGYGYLTGRWQETEPPAEVAAIKKFIERSHESDREIAFACKLHGSVCWDDTDYNPDTEEDRFYTYFFANNQETAKILCKYLPPFSLSFTQDRLGLRPRGRFERYIHDNFNCDMIFASETPARFPEDAREQGRKIFKALFESL
jgi:hypothetical protein